MACCVAQRLTLSSRCALPAPVLPSLQSRSLGKIRKSALREGGLHILIGGWEARKESASGRTWEVP